MGHGTIDRRRFIRLGAGGVAALATAGLAPRDAPAPGATSPGTRARRRAGDPFTLGVASGDPTPDGVVLWTRLAPDPLHGGGMPDRAVPVGWEVAGDERFRRVVRRGTALAVPDLGHSVHVEVSGLRPGDWYWYRFRQGPWLSPVGRTRTAPAAGAAVDRVAFAVTSCQNWSAGFYTAHRHMSEEDLDFVVELGDYVYESPADTDDVRPHDGTGEPVTLEQYRNRHALYKTDADLQACHAAFPWLVVPDDHEIDNNWADDVPQDPDEQPHEAFLARRAAAFRAYYEHMPLRRSAVPRGIDMQLYRRLTFGDLVDVHMLDTRQHRSDQSQARRLDSTRTLLGEQQREWLLAGLAGPTARWNVLAQQVFFSQRDTESGPGVAFSDDKWDDVAPERDAVRDHMAAVGTSNPVVLTGDVHGGYVCDIKADFDDPDSATVGTELVATSLSSGGDGVDLEPADAALLADNPHIRYMNRKRGYIRNVVTRSAWTADFRTVERVTVPGAPIATKARFVVEDGRAGAQAV